MLPACFIAVAIFLRLYGSTHYALAVIKRRARPNPVSWFFWALTAAIVFVAQLAENVGWSAATTFALALGPLIIFLLSIKYSFSRAHFTPSTIACAIFAAVGIVLWLNAKDPIIAIVFSIFADAFSGIPTVIKAWHDPESEYLPAYALSMLSMAITLLTLTNWDFASYAFPLYILGINLIIFCIGYFRQLRLIRIRAIRQLRKVEIE